VSISYIYKALERRRATGEVTPQKGGGSRPPKLAGHDAALLAHLRAQPDATLAELRCWLFETRGVSISNGCLWNALERLGWTLKKSHSARQSRTARTSPPPVPSGGRPSPA
jgi:transposase